MMSEEDYFHVACVHGRFQPPHLEHLQYIQAALSKADHLYIGIAQPDAPHLEACEDDPHRALLPDNPLNYVERCDAIERMLNVIQIPRDKYSFVKFPIDTVEKLPTYIPKDVVCFTTIRDEWNLRKIEKLESQGYRVIVLWDKRNEKGISGTDIRKRIRASDETWRNKVHPAVADYLISNELIARIKSI